MDSILLPGPSGEPRKSSCFPSIKPSSSTGPKNFRPSCNIIARQPYGSCVLLHPGWATWASKNHGAQRTARVAVAEREIISSPHTGGEARNRGPGGLCVCSACCCIHQRTRASAAASWSCRPVAAGRDPEKDRYCGLWIDAATGIAATAAGWPCRLLLYFYFLVPIYNNLWSGLISTNLDMYLSRFVFLAYVINRIVIYWDRASTGLIGWLFS